MKFIYLLFFILLINCKNSGKLEVYPKDIGVVIALGDSITAATHSDNIPAFESKVFYIYNKLYRVFLSQLVVYIIIQVYIIISKNIILMLLVQLKVLFFNNIETLPIYSDEGFNLAIAGSCTYNLGEQLDNAIKRMKSLKNFDYEHTWKLFTIFSGGNDLCDMTIDTDVDELGYNITDGLDLILTRISTEVPYSYVNLMGILDPSKLYDPAQSDVECVIQNTVALTVSCPLAKHALGRYCIREVSRKANEMLHQVIKHHPSHDTFILNYHPMTEGFMLDDTKYISRVDCFHPNTIAHGLV